VQHYNGVQDPDWFIANDSETQVRLPDSHSQLSTSLTLSQESACQEFF
jgi:hypothetical protein